ncbi:cryptochrome-2-like isoform X2 [Crassostrea virginica]
MKTCAIHWFRKGLRLHDNPALLAACKAADDVKPVFILDPWFPKNANVGINRWRFLLQTLQNLDDNLKKVNSRLYVVKGKPNEVFPKLFKHWGVSHLTFEEDTEPYAVSRDSEIQKIAKEHNVEVTSCVSHTLFDTQRTISKNGGKAPLTYQRLQTVLSSMGSPPKPVESPTKCQTKTEPDHDKKYGVPSLEELGKSPEDCGPLLFPGGETEALRRMESMIQKKSWICSFEKPKTEPNSLEPSTTVLSPYLKFGCLSPRLFYYKLQEVYSKAKHTSPPVSLHGQLLWREFFYTVAADTANFDKMEGNPVCKQIPWDINEEYLKAWKEVFEEYLLDADWSLNAGNWMWLSASAFFHQYFRVYSPIEFGKKTDKDGNYIRKYVPQLSKFPKAFIYEPWKAPLDIQKKAGCIIGKDYPKAIVNHDQMRKKNIERMANAYNSNKTDGGGEKRKSEASSVQKKKKRKVE